MVFCSKRERIKEHQDTLLKELKEEEVHYGSYGKWYNDCEIIRKQIFDKYVLFSTPWRTYRVNRKADPSWFYDHHIISYIAPLNIQRVGWGGGVKRLLLNR